MIWAVAPVMLLRFIYKPLIHNRSTLFFDTQLDIPRYMQCPCSGIAAQSLSPQPAQLLCKSWIWYFLLRALPWIILRFTGSLWEESHPLVHIHRSLQFLSQALQWELVTATAFSLPSKKTVPPPKKITEHQQHYCLPKYELLSASSILLSTNVWRESYFP